MTLYDVYNELASNVLDNAVQYTSYKSAKKKLLPWIIIIIRENG